MVASKYSEFTVAFEFRVLETGLLCLKARTIVKNALCVGPPTVCLQELVKSDVVKIRFLTTTNFTNFDLRKRVNLYQFVEFCFSL